MNVAIGLLLDPHYERLTPFAVVAFILGGLAGSAVGRRWNYLSIDLLGPSRSATIRSTSPVFTALIAVALYQEEISPVRWGAIIAIVAGAALVSWTPGAGARGWLSLGVLYALGAAVAYGCRPIFIKAGLEDANIPVAASIIGATAAFVYTVARENLESIRTIRVDRSFWLFFLGGMLQTISQLALAVGLSLGEVSLVYSLTASAPLFTLLFTAILLRGVDRLSPQLVLGCAAVVVGVIYL
jgi:drug/metabolite transporter (DMT)-like permease